MPTSRMATRTPGSADLRRNHSSRKRLDIVYSLKNCWVVRKYPLLRRSAATPKNLTSARPCPDLIPQFRDLRARRDTQGTIDEGLDRHGSGSKDAVDPHDSAVCAAARGR